MSKIILEELTFVYHQRNTGEQPSKNYYFITRSISGKYCYKISVKNIVMHIFHVVIRTTGKIIFHVVPENYCKKTTIKVP
jgi:hypothetical protein